MVFKFNCCHSFFSNPLISNCSSLHRCYFQIATSCDTSLYCTRLIPQNSLDFTRIIYLWQLFRRVCDGFCLAGCCSCFCSFSCFRVGISSGKRCVMNAEDAEEALRNRDFKWDRAIEVKLDSKKCRKGREKGKRREWKPKNITVEIIWCAYFYILSGDGTKASDSQNVCMLRFEHFTPSIFHCSHGSHGSQPRQPWHLYEHTGTTNKTIQNSIIWNESAVCFFLVLSLVWVKHSCHSQVARKNFPLIVSITGK